jgi:hypothetical protein
MVRLQFLVAHKLRGFLELPDVIFIEGALLTFKGNTCSSFAQFSLVCAESSSLYACMMFVLKSQLKLDIKT